MDRHERIFVAGHRGLVGSAILDNLRNRGYDNFILRTHKECDLGDMVQTERLFMQTRPDYVFLAAAFVGGIMANSLYRADFIYNNLQIQNNVIHCAYKYGVKKLLFLGSTCIYPREAPQPIREESLLGGELEYTNEPYALAKIAGLKMCESYNLQYGTNFIAVMPTNLYGPNDNFDLETSHVMPALMRKAHLGRCLQQGDWQGIRRDLGRRPIEGVDASAGEEKIRDVLAKYGVEQRDGQTQIELWGSGSPLREFLWSGDMADACVYIMERVDFCDTYEKGEKQVRNCHINIGTGEETSIKNLFDMVCHTVGYTGGIRYDSSKPDGTPRKLTDVSKLHALGWKHSVGLREGIGRLYEWYLSD